MEKLLADDEWRAVLSRVGTARWIQNTDDDGSVLWFANNDLDFQSFQPGAALALLAMVGLIDGQQWQRAIDVSFRRRIDTVRERLDTIRWNTPMLGLCVVLGTHTQKRLTERVFVFDGVAPSWAEHYATIHNKLTDQIASKGIDLSAIDLRTPVTIQCTASRDVVDSATELLAQARLLAVAQRHFDDHGRAIDFRDERNRIIGFSRFRIHQVSIENDVFSQGLDWGAIQHTKAILECGVKVSNLPQFVVPEFNAIKEEALDVFRVLFPSTKTSLGVGRVEIGAHDLETMAAVCSALRLCQSVRRVEFHARDEDSTTLRHKWQWFAYALFSRGATHQIDKIAMSNAIDDDAIAAMREVITARNPLAVLFGGDPTSTPAGQVHARRFRLRDPTTRNDDQTNQSGSTWSSHSAVVADVIDQRSVWWQVLLPGFGRAWVHQDNIELHVTYDKLPDAHSVSTFETEGDADVANVVAMLEMIGPSVTTANITVFSEGDESLQSDTICQILTTTCPRLENLRMPMVLGPAACLDAVIECAEQGVSRLQSYEVRVHRNDDPTTLIRFLNVLSDNSHPLTIHLKQLRFAVDVFTLEDLGFMDALVDMLAQNQSITTFTLSIMDKSDTGNHELEIASQLSLPADEFETSEEINAPVRSKCRLAFLSVVDAQRSAGSAMGQLDSSLLSTIFDFAVHRFTRTVDLNYN